MSSKMWELYNTFQIMVMWDTHFVKTCKFPKLLNNKDYATNMSPSYCKSLVHVQQIWDSYDKPLPNLDLSFRHLEKYKLKQETPLTLS